MQPSGGFTYILLISGLMNCLTAWYMVLNAGVVS
jgi:hypothetical protein